MSIISEMDSFRQKYGRGLTKGVSTFSINSLLYLLNKQPLRGPLFFGWDITYKCDSRCKTCDRWQLGLKDTKKELNTKQALALVKELGKLKVWLLSLGGGEPLLRKDLPIILKEAKKQGMNINLNTNGILLKPFAKTLIDLKIDTITVSLESHIPKVHDSIRRYKNSFKLAEQGIEELKRLRKRRKPIIAVRANISKKNYKNIKDYLDYWENKVDEVIFQPLHTSDIAFFKVDKDLKISEKDKEEFEKYFNSLTKNNKQLNKTYYKEFVNFFFNPKLLHQKYKCFAADFYAIMDPYGNVFPCSDRVLNLGNINKETFTNIWKGEKIRKFREIMRNKKNKCLCWYNCNGILNCYLTKTLGKIR